MELGRIKGHRAATTEDVEATYAKIR